MQSFYSLLDAMIAASPEEREAQHQRLLASYEVERAVLALDMSGFSMLVRRGGIVPHLCRIRQMQRLAMPLIAGHGGEVVKCEADNILAVFLQAHQAVDAAVAINAAIQATDTEAQFSVAMGIDIGRILLIPGQDCFGDAVNIAYKLGEDIARAGEILVTDKLRQALTILEGIRLDEQRLSVSGLEIVAHLVSGRR